MTDFDDPGRLAALHARAIAPDRPWSADEIAALAAQPGSLVIARAEGFLLGRALAGEAEVLTLVVDPGARRAGIGRALLAAFIDAARDKDAETAFLEVAEDNAAALALYRASGFTEQGRRRGYYRRTDHAVDALVLGRPLAPVPGR